MSAFGKDLLVQSSQPYEYEAPSGVWSLKVDGNVN